MKCVACQNPHVVPDLRHVSAAYPLLRCPSCGLGMLDVPIEEGQETYDEYWDETNERIYSTPAVVAELARKYTRYLRWAEDRAPNRLLLDVGSGAGIFVEQAIAHGFDASGVEPSPRGVQCARKARNVPVTVGLLSRTDELPRENGVLSLWDVIEHVRDPEELLRACNDHLAPDGVLLLETPDEGAALRKAICWLDGVTRSRLRLQRNIYYKDHRYYFTRTAMAALLEHCGFDRIVFFGDHTMFRKSLEKLRLYRHISFARAQLYSIVFWLLKRLPLTANKMVVICQKNGHTPT